MSQTGCISTDELKERLLTGSARIVEARDELCALDAVAGDGDLGATLSTGFTSVAEMLGDFDGRDAGAMLTQVGVVIGRKAPSTIGALLMTAFLRAGRAVNGVSDLDAAQVAALLAAATSGVSERGEVTLGMRTIVDALDGSAASAAEAAAAGVDAAGALRQAAVGARAGAEATALMEPRVGRAGWLKDRARGAKDGGAVAWAVFMEGMAEG
jgi:dihydroxyacetone kinase